MPNYSVQVLMKASAATTTTLLDFATLADKLQSKMIEIPDDAKVCLEQEAAHRPELVPRGAALLGGPASRGAEAPAVDHVNRAPPAPRPEGGGLAPPSSARRGPRGAVLLRLGGV